MTFTISWFARLVTFIVFLDGKAIFLQCLHRRAHFIGIFSFFFLLVGMA